MGGADNICSDKTGTLTMNEMTLTTVWVNDYVEINYAGHVTLESVYGDNMKDLIAQGCGVNSSATLRPNVTVILFSSFLGFYYRNRDSQKFRQIQPSL